MRARQETNSRNMRDSVSVFQHAYDMALRWHSYFPMSFAMMQK
jgi:hypothetical protein